MSFIFHNMYMPVHSASRSETTSSAPGRHCQSPGQWRRHCHCRPTGIVCDWYKWGGSRQSVSNSRRTFKCKFFEILLKIYIVYCTQSILGEFLPQVLSLDIFSPRPPPFLALCFLKLHPKRKDNFLCTYIVYYIE